MKVCNEHRVSGVRLTVLSTRIRASRCSQSRICLARFPRCATQVMVLQLIAGAGCLTPYIFSLGPVASAVQGLK